MGGGPTGVRQVREVWAKPPAQALVLRGLRCVMAPEPANAVPAAAFSIRDRSPLPPDPPLRPAAVPRFWLADSQPHGTTPISSLLAKSSPAS